MMEPMVWASGQTTLGPVAVQKAARHCFWPLRWRTVLTTSRVSETVVRTCVLIVVLLAMVGSVGWAAPDESNEGDQPQPGATPAAPSTPELPTPAPVTAG